MKNLFQERYLFSLLFTLLLIAQVVDVVYTREFVLAGGEEANPIADMLIEHAGWWGLLFVKVFPCIMGIIVSFHMKNTERWVKALVWLGVAVYTPLLFFHMNNIGLIT